MKCSINFSFGKKTFLFALLCPVQSFKTGGKINTFCWIIKSIGQARICQIWVLCVVHGFVFRTAGGWWCNICYLYAASVNTLRPRQDGLYFPENIFKCIFLNEIIRISIKNSLKFVPSGPINKITALVQVMYWRRPGYKPLSEPMMVSLLTHICVTRSQWVNSLCHRDATLRYKSDGTNAFYPNQGWLIST